MTARAGWAGTTVIITGASRGIGRAVAEAAVARGARVGLVARSGDELREISDQLGAAAAHAVGDVTAPDSIAVAVAELAERLGPPGILVNNAGVGSYASFLEEDPDAFERLMRVNYLGAVHATRAVLGWMFEGDGGHIVNVASVAGRLGAPFESAYSASKFAMVGWSEAIAAELDPLGVRVSLVEPGPVRTSFTETRGVDFQRSIPRPQPPERIARAVLRAVDRDRIEQVLPRWLALPPVVRAVTPGLYRRGVARSFRQETAELARRLRGA